MNKNSLKENMINGVLIESENYMKMNAIIKKFLFIACVANGLSSFSHAMYKGKAQEKSSLESTQSGNASAIANSIKWENLNFTAEELDELETRAQAYINASKLAAQFNQLADISNPKFIELRKFLIHMHSFAMNRFLSFFKNKKDISGDDVFGNKTFFLRLKERVGAKAHEVFGKIESYPNNARVGLRKVMNELIQETNDPDFLLIDAIGALDIDEVEKLLKSGVDPMQFDANQYAPFYYALPFQDVRLIELFAKYAKDDEHRKQLVNLKNNNGLVPLLLMPQVHKARDVLEKYGADINFADAAKQTPLHTAIMTAQKGDVAMVSCLVANKARVTQDDYDFATQCFRELSVKDHEAKEAFKDILELFQGKIKEREALELKIKAAKKESQAKPQTGTGSAAAGSAAAEPNKDSKQEKEVKAIDFDESEALKRVAQLTQDDLEDLERRAQACSNIGQIPTLNKIPASMHDAKIVLMQEVRKKMSDRHFARFLSFFKDKGLMGPRVITKIIVKKVASKALKRSKEMLRSLLDQMQKDMKTAITLFDRLIEDNPLDRFVEMICVDDKTGIDRFLNKKLNPNQFDGDNYAPLYYAIMLNRQECIQKLLKAPIKADINIANNQGLSALFIAHTRMPNATMLTFLLLVGAQLSEQSIENVIKGIRYRELQGRFLIVSVLMQQGDVVVHKVKNCAMNLFNAAQQDEDKALYAQLLDFVGIPMIQEADLKKQLQRVLDTWDTGSVRGNVPETLNARQSGMNIHEIRAIALDDSAIEKFNLSSLEKADLEMIAQACTNINKCAENIKTIQKVDIHFALLERNFLCARVLLPTLFNSFFVTRNINPSKFQYGDFNKRMQEKVGPKAAAYIAVMGPLMKNENFPVDHDFTQLKSDKKLLLLIAALMAQDVDRVKELLKNGGLAVMEEEDQRKLMPMHFAIMSALADPSLADELIRILIDDYKVNVNTPNFFGCPPILLAHASLKLNNPALLKPALAQATLIRAIYASRSEGSLIVKALIQCGLVVGDQECKLIDELMLKSQRLPANDANKTSYVANSLEVQKILRDARKIQQQKAQKEEQDEKARLAAQAKEKRDKKRERQAQNKERRALETAQSKQEENSKTEDLKVNSAPLATELQTDSKANRKESQHENPPAQEAVAPSATTSTKLELTSKEIAAYNEERERALRAHNAKMVEEYGKSTATLFDAYVPPTRANKAKAALQTEAPVVKMPAQQRVERRQQNNQSKAAKGSWSGSGSAGVTKKISGTALMQQELELANKRIALENERRKENEEKERKEKENAQRIAHEEELVRMNNEVAQMQAEDTYRGESLQPVPTAISNADSCATVVGVPRSNISPEPTGDLPVFDQRVRNIVLKPTAKLSEAFKIRLAQKAEAQKDLDTKRAQDAAALAQYQANLRASLLAVQQQKEDEKKKKEEEARREAQDIESLKQSISLRGTAQEVYERHIKDFYIHERMLRQKQLALWIQCGGAPENFSNPSEDQMPVIDKYQKKIAPLTFENQYAYDLLDYNNRRLNGNEAFYCAWLKAHHKVVQGTGCNTCCRFDYATQQQVQQLCASA